MIVMSFLALTLSSAAIRTFEDLKNGAVYIDYKSKHFLQISDSTYIWGTPISLIDSSTGDVPQSEGGIDDCSTQQYRCKQFTIFRIISPNGKRHGYRSVNIDGQLISVSTKGNVVHGSSICADIGKTGCISTKSVNRPFAKYEYDIKKGVLVRLKVTYFYANFNDKSRYLDLTLRSGEGYRI